MVFFSFGNKAFNIRNSESNIDIIVSPKDKYATNMDFLNAVVRFLDEKVFPGEGIRDDYEGMYLKEGNFKGIVEHWIESMNQSVEINMDDVVDIQRIECESSNPLRDEFLIETSEEYIMFLWSTSA